MSRDTREQRGRQVQKRRLSVVLPLPPSTNRLYATVYGRRVLSKAGRSYHHDAGWLVKEAAAMIGWEAAQDGRYAVELTLFWPDRRRHDLDNSSKCLLDSATSALGFDDSTIDLLVLRRGPIDREQPRAELTISVLV